MNDLNFQEENAVWARMIDGRTIYFFVLLAERWIESTVSFVAPDSTAFSEGFEQIQSVGLDFFCLFKMEGLTDAVEALKQVSTSRGFESAVAILNSFTQLYVNAWAKIEADVHMQDESLCRLRELFVKCIECEFFRRLSNKYVEAMDSHSSLYSQLLAIRPDVVKILLEEERYPILVELACSWYPCWPRYRFIIDSGFDHTRELPLGSESKRDALNKLRHRINTVIAL